MFIANEFKNTEARPNNSEYREGMLVVMEDIINNIIADKPTFSIEDFSAIYFDEYSMETNCHKDIISTMFVVIDQPNNYKLDKIKISKKSKDNKIKFPDLYYTLDEFKDNIFEQLLQYLDPNNMLWKDSNSIIIKTTDYNEEHGINNFFLKIIPCIAHYNENNIKGIMYLVNNQVQIEYPDIALENYHNKNTITDDVFRQVNLIFKNILLKNKKIERLPSEIIETILYNVPSEMFLNDNYDSLIRIINYLRNKSVKDYKTLDEQDYAFSSLYRSMSSIYVKHILKIIEKYLLDFQ